jgi:transposase
MRILSTTFREGSVSVRGEDQQTADMFRYLSPEARVRRDHPLRTIRQMTDAVLKTVSPRFARMYSDIGQPSIPPEQLLRALLLQALYTIRSERLLMEEIDDSILFRWFIGLSLDEAIWSPTVFRKNRDRLLQGDIASAFVDAVLDQARAGDRLSDELVTVDGTRLVAWASLKSFRRTDAPPTPPPEDPGNPTVNFHGEPRNNDPPRVDDQPGCATLSHRPREGSEAGGSGTRAPRQSSWPGGECRRDGGDRHGGAGRRTGAVADRVARENRRRRQTRRRRLVRGEGAGA